MLTIPGLNEMQIKTTLIFHITPIGIAIIKNTTNSKCWKDVERKGTLTHWWCEGKLVQPLWQTIERLLKKLNIYLTYDPAIPLLGLYPKECDSGYSKDICILIFIAVLVTRAKLWK
jgi:hypothetical protein